MINGDFETRSEIDLLKEGLYRYVESPTTKALCLATSVDGGDPILWRPGDKIPLKLKKAVNQKSPFYAWNSSFERLIYWTIMVKRYNWPMIPMERFFCTASQARAMGWPRRLENAAKFAGLPFNKDAEGSRVMKKMCKPLTHHPVTWWDEPEDYEKLYEYCRTDVRVEMGLGQLLRPLDERERACFLLNERMNDRGWRVDIDLARRAVAEAEELKADLNERIEDLTNGAVTAVTQNDKLLQWLNTTYGFGLQSVEKRELAALLSSDTIDPVAAEVIDIRLQGAKAAVSKYQALLNRASDDGYLRGLYLYHGAGQTGRFTAQGVQVHNLIRDSLPDEVTDDFKNRGLKAFKKAKVQPMTGLARMVRQAFLPTKKKQLVVGDWKAIEAIILPWQAEGCGIDTEGYLQAWRDGKPIYEMQAVEIFSVELKKVTQDQRRSGKICVLAFGYEGGANAYLTMSRGYGETGVDEKTALQYCRAWRAANPWAPKFWKLLSSSAVAAMRTPEEVIDLGSISFVCHGDHLYMKIPSGRVITYPFASLSLDKRDNWRVSYKRGNRNPKNGSSHWPTVDLYGGLLAENATQATARDILVDTLLRSEDSELIDLVGHTHDEVVAEFSGGGKAAMKELDKLMCVVPSWAKGLPLSAELWTGGRYG